MGRTSNLPFISLFKSRSPKPSPSPWPWPSCNQPKTLSFRLLTDEADDNVDNQYLSNPSTDSCFSISSSMDTNSLSTASECPVEAAMRAMSSNRLLFDGRSDKSSLITEIKVPFEGSVAVELESEDLYGDFRVSMKEMVEANGEVKKDLAWYDEMLGWYLRMNKRRTHEFIVGAYLDLLLEMMGSSYSSTTTSSRSASLSSCCSCSTCASSSSYFSCLSEIEEVVEEEGGFNLARFSLL